jgi:N12 class adenine-specific DNA methylase
MEKLEDFLRRGLEFDIFIQESLARSMKLHHSLNICHADLEARPEAYPIFGNDEERQRRMEAIRQRAAMLDQMVVEIEEWQRTNVDSKTRLAILDEHIARRRAGEQCEWDELDFDSDSE